MRCVDLMYALPALLVAIVVVGVVGGGYCLAVALLVDPLLAVRHPHRSAARRSSSASLPYVEAAQRRACRARRIMLAAHLAERAAARSSRTRSSPSPSASSRSRPCRSSASASGPGTADWGRMLSESRTLLFDNPWAALAPGIALVLTAALGEPRSATGCTSGSPSGGRRGERAARSRCARLRIESRVGGRRRTIVDAARPRRRARARRSASSASRAAASR